MPLFSFSFVRLSFAPAPFSFALLKTIVRPGRIIFCMHLSTSFKAGFAVRPTARLSLAGGSWYPTQVPKCEGPGAPGDSSGPCCGGWRLCRCPPGRHGRDAKSIWATEEVEGEVSENRCGMRQIMAFLCRQWPSRACSGLWVGNRCKDDCTRRHSVVYSAAAGKENGNFGLNQLGSQFPRP